MKLKDLLKDKISKKSKSDDVFKDKVWKKNKMKTPIDPTFDTKEYENEKENIGR